MSIFWINLWKRAVFRNRKNAQNLFLAEGETEVKLIESLIRDGNVRKFNMWTEKPGRIIKLIGSSHNLYVVYDTDQIHRNERNTFISNIVTFAKNCASITFLQQSGNLEDELCRALSCSKKALYSFFNARGVRGFKEI